MLGRPLPWNEPVRAVSLTADGHTLAVLVGEYPENMHKGMAAVMDTMLDRIAAIQKAAREEVRRIFEAFTEGFETGELGCEAAF